MTKDSTLPPALTFVDKKSDSSWLQFWRRIQIKILVWVSRQNCNHTDKLTDVIYFMTGFGRDRPNSGRVEYLVVEKEPLLYYYLGAPSIEIPFYLQIFWQFGKGVLIFVAHLIYTVFSCLSVCQFLPLRWATLSRGVIGISSLGSEVLSQGRIWTPS